MTVSRDKTAQVWDAATGTPIGKPLRHNDEVSGASFSPDGTRVMTVSKDAAAQMWDGATGEPIGQPLRNVSSASFSPDGALVLTASGEAARVWLAPPVAPNIVATACKMLRDHDTADLSTRYGVEVKDPICIGTAPSPDPALTIDH